MNRERPCILVVEDEPSIGDNIAYALESEGFEARVCPTAAEALAAAEGGRFALAIVDVGLPDLSGFEVCRRLKRSGDLPLIFLTARSSEIDRVAGLEMGGDDYMTKPFSPRELTARVRAVLRRGLPAGSRPEPVAPGDPPLFEVDDDRFVIRYGGVPLALSRYEFRLLKALLKRPGRVYSRAQLMDEAWEEPEASMERTVDSHIKSLRAKLRDVRPGQDPIRTRRGLGYSLELTA